MLVVALVRTTEQVWKGGLDEPDNLQALQKW
jgi:hypothetical protein